MDANLGRLVAVLTGALTMAGMPVAAKNAAEADIVGEAREQTRGELLYHELHYFSEQGSEHQVIYRAPDGEILAEKSLDYSASNVQPQFEQQNFACGESIGVSHDEDSLEVSYRSDHQEELSTRQVERQNTMVIDAGFDHLVRQNWELIAAGDSLDFDYLVPSRFASYAFRLRNADCSKSAEEGWQCFAIEPASWWMRMLVDPVSLTYDRSSRRLVEFRGIGNIPDVECKYPQVQIRYQYAEQASAEGEAKEEALAGR